MNTKTHWKTAFNSDYLSSLDVPEGKDLILTIKEVKLQEVKNKATKKGEINQCNVAHFVEAAKPMVLNVTNSKMVRKFANNSNYIEDWAGIKIRIYVNSNVKFGKETVEALRIRDIKIEAEKPVDVTAYVDTIEGFDNLDDLKTYFQGLPKEIMANKDVKEATNRIKALLS